jgi:hypothetical protein
MTESEWEHLRARLNLLMADCIAEGRGCHLWNLTQTDRDYIEKDLKEFFDPLKAKAVDPG